MYHYVLLLSWMVLSGCALKQASYDESPVQNNQPVVEPYRMVEDKMITIAAVGDMMLGGSAEPYLENSGYDYPFNATRHLLAGADIAIGNLETALTDRGESLVEKKYRFRNSKDKVPSALKAAGFDIVSLANNHTLDYGPEGLHDTFAALQQAGIKYHGAGDDHTQARQPVIFEFENGLRFGFLAYSNTFPQEFWATGDRPGTAFGHEQHIREDVRVLKGKTDVVVVSFHWGREGEIALQPYQILLAHAAIDAGASLVLGHHPHILQAVEEYQGGLILYSLGNYVFGSFSNRVQYSVVAAITFKNGHYDSLRMMPINVNNFQVYFQPQILEGEKAEAVFSDLHRQSLLRNTRLIYDNHAIVTIKSLTNELSPTLKETQ